jgi:RNA-directed DNA polymerase
VQFETTVPTVADRVAQMVVKQLIEPDLDPIFLADSYGYRPRKSALDAVGVTRERCWKYDWVLEFDIKGLFDNIDHELLLRAVQKHVKCKWALLYIERWLTASMEQSGVRIERTRGTPQGGVISPILSNLFLHYTFDLWMERTHPDLPWCRYADDGLVHCRTEQEAETLKAELQARLAECRLELHPTKTKIVYCRDGKRKGAYPNVKFDFLGYCFRPRWIKKSQDNSMFCGFNPAVSTSALNAMRSTIRDLNIRQQTQLSLADIARIINPLLSGWIEYYGRYAPSALSPMLRYVNQTLVRWAMRKFKRFKAHKIRASRFLQKLVRDKVSLFVHWRIGMTGTFA